ARVPAPVRSNPPPLFPPSPWPASPAPDRPPAARSGSGASVPRPTALPRSSAGPGHRPASHGSAAAFLGPVGHLGGQGTDDPRCDSVDVEADVCEDLLPRDLRQELIGDAQFDDTDAGLGHST